MIEYEATGEERLNSIEGSNILSQTDQMNRLKDFSSKVLEKKDEVESKLIHQLTSEQQISAKIPPTQYLKENRKRLLNPTGQLNGYHSAVVSSGGASSFTSYGASGSLSDGSFFALSKGITSYRDPVFDSQDSQYAWSQAPKVASHPVNPSEVPVKQDELTSQKEGSLKQLRFKISTRKRSASKQKVKKERSKYIFSRLCSSLLSLRNHSKSSKYSHRDGTIYVNSNKRAHEVRLIGKFRVITKSITEALNSFCCACGIPDSEVGGTRIGEPVRFKTAEERLNEEWMRIKAKRANVQKANAQKAQRNEQLAAIENVSKASCTTGIVSRSVLAVEADGNVLSIKEVKQMLKRLNVNVPHSEVVEWIQKYDDDKNGRLNFAGFKKMFYSLQSVPDLREEFLRAKLKEADDDKIIEKMGITVSPMWQWAKYEYLVPDNLVWFFAWASNGEDIKTEKECAKLIEFYSPNKKCLSVSQQEKATPDASHEVKSTKTSNLLSIFTQGSAKSFKKHEPVEAKAVANEAKQKSSRLFRYNTHGATPGRKLTEKKHSSSINLKHLQAEELRKELKEKTKHPETGRPHSSSVGGLSEVVSNKVSLFSPKSSIWKFSLKAKPQDDGVVEKNIENLQMNYQSFVLMLIDLKRNRAVDPQKVDVVYQDMTHPLPHYFISSTHNSYLIGNQLNSESSPSALSRILKHGVRVIELDCWDGPEGNPIVNHGYSLCKPTTFEKCIQIINEYAFFKSCYPLIITLENHCSKKQQKKQVKIMRTIFREKLFLWDIKKSSLRHSLPEAEITLKALKDEQLGLAGPIEYLSPEDLKYKIVIRDRPIKKSTKKEKGHLGEKSKLLNQTSHPNGKINVNMRSAMIGMKSTSSSVSVNTNSSDDSKSHPKRKGFPERRNSRLAQYAKATKASLASPRNVMHSLTMKKPQTIMEDCPSCEEEKHDVLQDNANVRLEKQIQAEKLAREKKRKQLFKFQSEDIDASKPVPSAAEEAKAVEPESRDSEAVNHEMGEKEKKEREGKEVREKVKSLLGAERHELRNSQSEIELKKLVCETIEEREKRLRGRTASFRSQSSQECNTELVLDKQHFIGKNSLIALGSKKKILAVHRDLSRLLYIRNISIPIKDSTLDDIKNSTQFSKETGLRKMKSTFPEAAVLKQSSNGLKEKKESSHYMSLLTKQLPSLLTTSRSLSHSDAVERSTQGVTGVASKKVIKSGKSSRIKYFEPDFASSSSIPEAVMKKLSTPGHNSASLNTYAKDHLIRIYPAPTRINSSNYDPVRAWNAGCQIVALNYQYLKMKVWLNEGKFMLNGGCGYVLKPKDMLEAEEIGVVRSKPRTELLETIGEKPKKDPALKAKSKPWTLDLRSFKKQLLRVRIISGHYLPKKSRTLKYKLAEHQSLINPYVELKLKGLKTQEYRTQWVESNGFNPRWNETFDFEVYHRELSLLAIVVKSKDKSGEGSFVAQRVLPVEAIRSGFRVVLLSFKNGSQIDTAHLLCRFTWE